MEKVAGKKKTVVLVAMPCLLMKVAGAQKSSNGGNPTAPGP